MSYENQRKLAEIERENHWAIATSEKKKAMKVLEYKMFSTQVALEKFAVEAKVISTSLSREEQFDAIIRSSFKLLKHIESNDN